MNEDKFHIYGTPEYINGLPKSIDEIVDRRTADLQRRVDALSAIIEQQQEQIATLQQSFLGMVTKMRQVVASVHTHEADKPSLITPDLLRMELPKGRKSK